MTNNTLLFISFIVVSILMLIGLFLVKKISFFKVLKNYFSIYFGGYIKKNENGLQKRKISPLYIITLGVFPYLFGALGALSFFDVLSRIDNSILAVFDGMLLSIMGIFFGFKILYKDTKEERTIDAKKETNSVLFVSIILLMIDLLLLAIYSANINQITNQILLCCYYALKTKILILFIICLHNVYNLGQNDIKLN